MRRAPVTICTVSLLGDCSDCIQSGLGWVHNRFMLAGIDKTVIRGPLRARPKPVWFYNHPKAHEVGPRLTAFEANPSWWRLPGVIAKAL